MTHPFELRAIAKEMKADNEAAYDVARLIHDQRVEEGFVPVGRKIGFTNPEMWDLYGVREPIWAPVRRQLP